jgi:hypothetical protein
VIDALLNVREVILQELRALDRKLLDSANDREGRHAQDYRSRCSCGHLG